MDKRYGGSSIAMQNGLIDAFIVAIRSFAIMICVVLGCAAVMLFPGYAWASLESDQTPATEQEIAQAFEEGKISFEQKGDSRSISVYASRSVPSPVSVESYAGESMFETAASIALAAYPGGCDTAVIAGAGDAWVDALSASGLAGSRGPVLFCWRDSLPAATADALRTLRVGRVVVVGGQAAVSDEVVAQLSGIGIALEARLAGDDAFGTQLAIFEYGCEHGLWDPGMIVVATGTGFGDALSVSPVAYARRAPVFLTGADGGFSPEQKDALVEAASLGYGAEVVVVGGEAVVSNYTVGFCDFISAFSGGSGSTVRLAGPTQYETSAAIAEWAVSSQGFTWSSPAFATGLSPYDGLAGAVLQGEARSPLLLVSGYDSAVFDVVESAAASVVSIRFLGGESAIDMRTRMGIADRLSIPFAAIPGFKVYIDAGHGWDDSGDGGYDPGATGSGYEEATITRELAGLVADILRSEYGVEVFLNDDGGWYKLRHAEAIAQGCDALVSIHFNSSGGMGATGSESLIHEYNASFLSQSWQQSIHPKLIQGTGLMDRGMKTQEVAILGGYLPATLLEVCFIDNSYDMNQYGIRKDEIAHRIAEGIVSR